MNWSQNAPLDQTALGEWGRFTPLGGGVHVGNFLSFLWMSESLGIWLNWFDQHLRVSGYNADFRTAAGEETVRNDEGELQTFHGRSLYPWEALGWFKRDEAATRENTRTEVQNTLHQGRREPIKPRDPFWRLREYGGYLGQGYLRELVVPADVESSNPNTTTSQSAVHPEPIREIEDIRDISQPGFTRIS